MILEFETERLLLRQYRHEDLTSYHQLKSDPRVWTFSTYSPFTHVGQSKQNLEEVIVRYAEANVGLCALIEKAGMRYVGEAGILLHDSTSKRAAWGYNLLPDFWGRGYATEASRKAVEMFLADETLVRLDALVMERNLASRRVLEKSHFQLEGTLRKYAVSQGESHNVCVYAVVKES